ncbi:chromosome segregation protein SMC [Candidatus Oscillochloris fontis]|uniref:chromosome segregation protein SMC n=1 Tax=Candidatus Oscillochloris fontis TaxID=2496868 RepID=UPI00101D9838|nr:chromosome segregation protein SMC [Candidatus Oscillochloris fontis]
MYLKRLDILGFKTFASRTSIAFQPGITAIVGPNGSGKSNIADAVRWVLGEQSLSTLRCKRSEELIYSGGGRRTAAGLAEVSLTIDNSDRLLPLDFDEVTITRRATRSGENEYFINRNRVRLRDLQAATEPLGGSYTIINQGLVDAALTLRPEERRRLFEDAAEIGGFDLRRAEALRRLRETDANLQRVADLLEELEPRLRALKRQAGQARQYRELHGELRTLQEQFFASQWAYARAETTRTRDEVARRDLLLDHARSAQLAASHALRLLRDGLREQRESLGVLHQQSSDLHRRAEILQRELAVDAERLSALSRRAEDLERRQQELAAHHAEEAARHTQMLTEVQQAETALEAQRHAQRSAEAELAEADRGRQALVREVRNAQEVALRAAASVAERASRAEQLRTQATRLEHDRSQLVVLATQAEAQVAHAQTHLASTQSNLAEAEATRRTSVEEERSARSALENLRSERANQEDQCAAARRRVADLEARLESLTRLARSYTGVFAGVRTAMQWAERSGRRGFALVQSIIRTPAEIETAIEVALGSRLQHVVVEQWQDAEEAINELKRSGAGRATFLPLDSIRGAGRSDLGGVTVDGLAVLGVAADLVTYDQRYAPVVQQLLGRVLLVRDLATARAELRRMSGGWTIVTLQGEQVQSSGAVTGGAQTKESGVLRRERELRELPDQVALARQHGAQAEQRRAEIEAQIQAQTHTLRRSETHLREAQRTLDACRAAVDQATRQLAQAEQERGWATQRQERLARDLRALEIEATTLAEECHNAETAAAVAEAHLAEVRSRQEAAAQSDRQAQERLAELRAAAGAAEGHLQAQRTLLAAHEQRLNETNRQVSAVRQSLAELEQEREQIDRTHTRIKAEHHALVNEIDHLRNAIDPAEQALAADEAAQNVLEQREQAATKILLEQEAAYSRATIEAQRASDRQDGIYERAAAEDIDVEALPVPESAQVDPNMPAAIESLRTKILRLGAVNQLALEEYEEASTRQRFLSEQVADLRTAETALHELIAELESAMNQRFTRTFHAVADEFEQSFVRLFGGGSARLQLTGASAASENGHIVGEHETDAPSSGRDQGVEIIVRPPGKKQQSIALLSGGERTLTAAALLFAILKVNPSPFCILDETDAALDESNVGRFREALAVLVDQTQFILITHNRGTIEAADTLYGVTMGDDGASKTFSLRVEV